MPFITKHYENDLQETSGSLAKAYSRLMRTILQNEEKVKSENAINATLERNVQFSDAPATMQANKKSQFVSTSAFK